MKKLWKPLLATLCVTFASQPTLASDYPNKTIRLIVPAAPGGTTDIAARMIAEPLGKALGQSVVVENKPGAAGKIATQQLLRSTADGYTLLLQYSGFQVITPSVEKVEWDPINDFTPVANVLSAPQVLVVKKNLPVNSLEELIALAKKNPNSLNYASSGNGALQHVATEQLNQLANIKTTHVPYKGTGPALTDLLAGSIDFTITTPPPLLAHIEAGALKALAVTNDKRIASLPNTPTTIEAGYPDLVISSWFAMYAPKDLPAPILEKLSTTIKKIMQSEEYKEKAAKQGAEAVYMGPEELRKYTAQELSRWKKVIDTAGIKAD